MYEYILDQYYTKVANKDWNLMSEREVVERGMDESGVIVMYTTTWCGDCWRAKQVMDSMDVDYREVNISEDEEAIELVMQLNNGHRSVPTIVFPDGSVLTEPRTTDLMEKLETLQQ